VIYKYFGKDNYEDFASGRVFYHKAGYPNYPVRLAGEIFSRCLEYSGKNEVTLYDPCCCCGYMVMVPGFLFNEKIISIHASDVSPEAVEISKKNLSLLTSDGIENRKNELTSFVENYGKDSHRDALQSLNRLRELYKHEITINCFVSDVLAAGSLVKKTFIADIVMTDVPYGGLSDWSENRDGTIDILLEGVKPVLTGNSVISISHTRQQKITNDSFRNIDTIKNGHRVIEFFRLK